ncbi:13515_t:CDS:2 [Cetraspora pellucida]|uniref:13515_t:CDS:1 n=1 Tax=Cetraspora pellucida TaxID=1433469 RepID=A0ACA9L9C9_9GLOM|nr:13515_t:CDS:2 [Cetraspora pellucida]
MLVTIGIASIFPIRRGKASRLGLIWEFDLIDEDILFSDYARARSTYLSEEVIKEIKNSAEYMKNRECKQQVDFISLSILFQNSRFIGDSPSHNFWDEEIKNEAIQEIKRSIEVVPNAINTMAKKYHISHSRVIDYIENREHQQQINSRLRIESEVLLQSKSLDDESEIRDSVSSLNHSSPNLHLESTTLNTEIKKKRSKSQAKSVLCNNEFCSHISGSTPTNNSIEKISSVDLDALYEKEARRDEKNKANMTHY